MRSIRLDTPVPTRFAVAGVAASALIAMQCFLVLAGSTDPSVTTLLVVSSWARSGWDVALYLVAATGYGALLSRALKLQQTHSILSLSIGLGLLLFLCSLLGTIGALAGAIGRGTSWLILLIGIALCIPLVRDTRKTIAERKQRTLEYWLLRALIVSCTVPVLTAATSAPGFLWSSEFGGFDALSYHLELPKRWLELGRIAALTDNIYSFLPGWVESSYVLLATLVGDAGKDAHAIDRFIAGDARSLISAQLSTASMCVVCALAVGSLVKAVCTRMVSTATSDLAPALATCVFLLTPWSIVVGSLAYNECAMVLFGVASWIVAMQQSVRPRSKAIALALLLGAGFGCKPTAAFMLAPITIVLAFAHTPAKHWIACAATAVILGSATLSPWILRNARVSSNPFMPFATSVFGTGHWTHEQADRFASAHTNHEPLFDRIAMLVAPYSPQQATGNTPPTHADEVGRHRGYTNPQWAFLPVVAFVGLVFILLHGSSQRIALCIAAALTTQLVAWVFLTHLQSRFLFPTLPPLCALSAIPVVVARSRSVVLSRMIAVVVLVLSVSTTLVFVSNERDGNPFEFAGIAPSAWNGRALQSALHDEQLSVEQRARYISQSGASAWINATLPPDVNVLLLGDAATLYVRSPYVMATTWDTSPITRVLADNPGTTPNWPDMLRSEGIGCVVVNLSELKRYRRDAWIDPTMTPDAIDGLVGQLGEPVWVASYTQIAAFLVQDSSKITGSVDTPSHNTTNAGANQP